MKARARSRPGFELIFTIAAALFATFLAVLATGPFGIGVTPDSVAYISAARTLHTVGTLQTFDSEPLVSWPPVFPVVLAIPGLIGIDALEAARFTNAFIFGLIVLVGSLLLVTFLKDRRLVLLGTAMVMLSEPLMMVSTRAWSEPLFVLVTTLFVLAFQKFIDTNDSRSLVLALVLAALASLIRYIGVTVIAAAGILLLLRSGPRFRLRVLQSALFVAVSTFPLALWLIRNHELSGTLAGPRAQAEITLLRNAGFGIGTLSEWFLPSALGMALYLWKTTKPERTNSKISSATRSIIVPAVFVCVYVLALTLSVAIVGVDPIDHRFLSPVYLPLLTLILVWLDRRQNHGLHDHSPAQCNWLIVVASLWLLWPCIDTGMRVMNYRRNGIRTYSTRAWAESALMQSVAELPPDAKVFSNAPDAIYIRTGRVALYSPYKREELTLANSARRLEKFLDHLQADSIAYLASFSTVTRRYLYSVDAIAGQCQVEPVAEFTDGTLHRLAKLQKVE